MTVHYPRKRRVTFQLEDEPDESKDSKSYRWHGNPPPRRCKPAAQFWNMNYNEVQIQSVWNKVVGDLSVEFSYKMNTSKCGQDMPCGSFIDKGSCDHLLGQGSNVEYSRECKSFELKENSNNLCSFHDCEETGSNCDLDDDDCWIPSYITHWECEDPCFDEIEMPFAMSPVTVDQQAR